ncbi:MAG: hypothetical protein CMH68_05925 [Nisaea sp.]|nr:hypothetical protein [Nisaea sp.]
MAKFLLVVFDGLRPELVTADLMPNLTGFRAGGLYCPGSRAAMPSETRVAVSSFVTGRYAGGHGVMGNSFYDPALGFDGPMDTSDLARMAIAEEHYVDGVLRGPDLGEVLAGAGKTLVTASTGKVGNARLLNLRAAARGQAAYSIHGAHVSSPAADHAGIEARFGPVPESDFPHIVKSEYLTTLVLEHFLPRHDPDVLIAWFSEPDLSYHYRGLGTDDGRAAMAGVDAAFGRLLAWWRAEGRERGWRIIAASDHAHITVADTFDLAAEMTAAGFAVGPAFGPDVEIALNPGYAGTLFVRDRAAATVDKILHWMTEQPWAGMLLARDRHGPDTGALDLAAIGMGGERAPDIFFTGRARDDLDPYGLVGTCVNGSPDLPIGGSTHGGLHPKEMNNFLCFGGDGFAEGAVFDGACGVVDVAPTILDGLALSVPASMDGRPLTNVSQAPADADRALVVEGARAGYWQSLTLRETAGGQRYIDGGLRLA